MALGPPRRSARTSNSTAVTSKNNDVDLAGTEEEIHLRGSLQLPPAIPNEEDRPLIEPSRKTHWVEVPTLGMDRTPASVLTCLLKDNHPGIVDYRGKSVAASRWVHYKAAKDTSGWSAADEVEAGLWLRFRYKPEDAEEISKHVGRCCGELLSSINYYARIQAILDHCRNVEKVNICDKVAGRRYLTREQYVAQKPKWCDEDAWRFFADKWSNSEWVQKSETNRANRYTPRYKPHRGGSNSIATVCQKLDVATHTGMVWTAVPPPPPPPPPPPTYGASSSPSCENNVAAPTGMARTAVPPPSPPPPPTYGAASSPSHENAPLNRSVNGENPDDTLARIAQGMFGGYINASGSGAGNHSPPVDDLGPF